MKNSRTSTVRLAAAVFVALALFALAPIGNAHAPGAPVTVVPHRRAEFDVDLGNLLAQAQRGSARLIVGDFGEQELELEPSDLFSTDNPQVVELDAEQNVISSTPLAVHPFVGRVAGYPDSTVALVVDEVGVYGTIAVDGVGHSYGPKVTTKPGAGMKAREVVEWAGIPAPRGQPGHGPVADPSAAQNIPNVISGGNPVLEAKDDGHVCSGGSFSATGDLHVFGDVAYRNYAADWATRISSAINNGKNMYKCYTLIDYKIHTVYSSINWCATPCDPTNCAAHLTAFVNGHLVVGGIDGYQLYTGANLAACAGMAAGPQTIGTKHSTPDSIIEAKDFGGSTYDPDFSWDLGLLAGTETAHVWGDPTHPLGEHVGIHNIMRVNYVDDSITGYWFNSGSGTTTAGYIRAAWGI